MTREVLQGSATHFGPRETAVGPMGFAEQDIVKTMVVKLLVGDDSGDDLRVDTAFNSDIEETYIPANSLLLDAKMYIKTAFTRTATGTTGIDVGLAEKDGGGAIDADAFFDGSDETVFANIDAANWWINGEGSSVGHSEVVSPVTEDAVITAAGVTGSSNDLTAGEAWVIVRYVPPPA